LIDPPRLSLPSITLIAVTSVNVAATISALCASMRQVEFGAVKLLTDKGNDPQGGIERIRIPPLRSAAAYSHFMLHDLLDHVSTDFALVVQWDGFVTHPAMWEHDFLSWDYVGAPWPQFRDGHDVGNGGFSLRSRKLLEACRDPDFEPSHPEDVAIGRGNRRLLEERHGIRFADAPSARRFSKERDRSPLPSFGFHGVFNMVEALGPERFWQIYSSLDERRGISRDLFPLARQIKGADPIGTKRMRLFRDLLGEKIGFTLRRRLGL
jgi:hypothetical protein